MRQKKWIVPFCVGLACLVLFGGLIAALKTVDVQPIGPEGSEVGLAALNARFAAAVGYQPLLYEVTDGLGKPVLLLAAGFGVLGAVQLLRRRSLKKVDGDLYVLAAFYAALAAVYVLFEKCVINCRPVLLEEGLEASFPSSHTVLAVGILGTAISQFRWRIRKPPLRAAICAGCIALMAVLVAGRTLSGVHWATDILGGLLIGGALVSFYVAAVRRLEQKKGSD